MANKGPSGVSVSAACADPVRSSKVVRVTVRAIRCGATLRKDSLENSKDCFNGSSPPFRNAQTQIGNFNDSGPDHL